MLKCSNCDCSDNLAICSECNTIVCSSCYKTKICTICHSSTSYRIYKENINGRTVDFVNLDKIQIGFCGFDRIDKNLMAIISSVNQINDSFENNNKLIIFPNKIESAKFTQKMGYSYKNEDEIIKHSKYSIVYTHEATFSLFNFENVKSNEISFLIKLLILQNVDYEKMSKELDNYARIYHSVLTNINKRIGINFVSINENEGNMLQNFSVECFKYFHEYFAYKKLLDENPKDLLDFLHYKIDTINKGLLNEYDFFYSDDLFGLYLHTLRLKLIENSVKNNQEIYAILHKRITEKIEETFSVHKIEEVKNVFLSSLSGISTQNFDTHQQYINFIESSINDISKQTPLIFLRYSEILALLVQGRNLVMEAQSIMMDYPKMKIIPNLSEMLKFVFKIDRILSFEIPVQFRIILLDAKFSILKDIIIISLNKTYFDLLLKTHNQFESLFLQNYKNLKKDELFITDFVDISIQKGGIGYIYFIFNEIKNAKEILIERRKLIDKHNMPVSLKIGMLFSNFIFFEDYSDLKKICKICRNSSINDEMNLIDSYNENIHRIIYDFSCFFSENKGDLLEVLNSIEDQIIIPQPVIKNFFEITGIKIFVGLLYHIINATKQDSPVLLISEVEKALKLAKEQNEINKQMYPYDYYLLKTQAIVEILNENFDEVKNIISNLDSYDLKTKDNFKNALTYWLDLTLDNYSRNIEILSKLKYVDDPWCNLIYKIIVGKIRQSSYIKAKNELEETKKFKTVNEQLMKFKEIIERDCINTFWKSRVKNNLMPQPEKIGKTHLITFLRMCEFYGHYNIIVTEKEIGVGKCDILTLSNENEINIFELKIVKSKRDIKDGIKELTYYITKENLKEGFLILFDTRKRSHKIEDSIVNDNKVINQFLIKINETAPSKQ